MLKLTMSLPPEGVERLLKLFAEGGPEAEALKAAGVVAITRTPESARPLLERLEQEDSIE